MNIKAALLQAHTKLAAANIENYQLEAQLFLAKALGKPQSFLYCHPEFKLSAAVYQQFFDFISERLNGMPAAYILGSQEFWQHSFKVTNATLIPRADTELLLELALNFAQNFADDLNILDMGTGSGCIAISLALALKASQVCALDISPAALSIARENAASLNAKNIQFLESNWFAALANNKKFALIISNPPYIAADDIHLKNLTFEPQNALIAADNGYADLKQIILKSRDFLVTGGYLLLEFGYQQGAQVAELLREANYQNIQLHQDLAGHIRAASARFA